MKTHYLHVRVTDPRLEKLHATAEERGHTLTRLVEDWIDRLPNPKQVETEKK